jgi:hypothetical protein
MSKRVCNLILAQTWSMHSVLPLKPGVTDSWRAMRPQSFLNLHFCLQEPSASGGRKHRKNNDHWTKDEGLFNLKTMIIGHRMKLFILMPRGSGLPTPNTATWKEYVTRILLAAVLERWATQSPPITRILLASKRSRRKKREKQKLAPYKIYCLRHS